MIVGFWGLGFRVLGCDFGDFRGVISGVFLRFRGNLVTDRG